MTQPQTQSNQTQSNQASTAVGRADAPAMQPAMLQAGSPLRLMRRLSADFDELFDQFFGNGFVPGMRATLAPPMDFIPAVETFERDGKLVVRADLPGLSPQDVIVEVANGVLTISGERQEKREVGKKGLRHTELRYGRFMRSIPLPEGISEADIQANFSDGVLEISVPIPNETQASRKIEVQSAQPTGQQSGQTAAAAA